MGEAANTAIELADRLSRYARHSIDCGVFAEVIECTCGLDDLREELATMKALDLAIAAKLREPIFLEMRLDYPANYRTPREIDAMGVWAGEPSPGATIPTKATPND